jgi:PAS domain S-box-containing protein
MDPRVIYCTPFFIAAMLIFVAALFTYRLRRVRGAWYLTFVCLAASVWAASEGMLYLGLDIKSNILITKLQYLGITPLPPLALLFVISIFGFEYLINRTRLLLLFLIAMIIIILIWTNPIHKLIFTDYYTIDSGPFPMLGLKHGLLWWIITFYHYSLIAILSVVVLFEVFSSASFHRSQAVLILVAVTVVWGLNAVYVSGNSPVPNMDIGPLAFTLVAASMAWGFFRYSLLDILPIARSEIFRGLNDAILVIDEKDRIMDINPAAESMFGIGVTEAIGQGALQFLGDHPQLHRLLGEMRPTEVCLITEGQERVYDFRGSALKDKRGAMLGRMIVLRNITDRKQTKEALKESEKRFRDISYSMADWIWEVDNNGRYTFASESVKEILGYPPEELIGKTPFDLMTEDDAKHIGKFFKRIVSEKKPIIDLENWNLTKKGKKICLLTNGVPMFDENGVLIGYRGVDKDITEAKHIEEEKIQLQTQLVQAQKMEAIGTLAGGIAHDFNNILAAIIGYAELAKVKAPEDSKVLPNLDQILKSGNRATTLIQQILAFSRKQELEQKPLQLKYIVKESLNFLRSTLPTDIEIKEDIAKDVGIVNADPTQMQQVIMNLCTNAGHAMQEEGGVLAVGLANVGLDDIAAAQYLDMNHYPYLNLSVSDTGHGMTSDVKDRIFEPYFTTKAPGEGTGMGLSVVHGIIKKHNGEITVQSEPGKGSTFHVYLPLIQEEVIKPEIDEQAPIPTGNERILFIDDEQTLVDMGKQMLERLGYEVTTRTSSIEALELFKVQPDRFDLVITDMTMSNMTGDKLAKELMKIRPNICIVICTGFSERISEERAKRMGIKAFAMKPIVMRDIANTVRKVLDEEKEGPAAGLILVIDDDDQFRGMLRETLEHAGYDVADAPNGKEGIRLYRENPADLVITDIIMPEKEGIETIRELKRDFPEVKIIAISGGGRIGPDSYLKMAKGLGAQRTLTKPLERDELLKTVRELINE